MDGAGIFERKTSSRVEIDDTTPLLCTIANAHVFEDHTVYCLKVQRGEASQNAWSLEKRYNEFGVLEACLKVSGIELPLPAKKIFGNMDREFVAERQAGLQQFMNAVLVNHMLALSVYTRKFLDPKNYDFDIQEMALQHVTMLFRSESQWEVAEPLPDIGWRLRKAYVLVKNNSEPKKKYMLSWCTFGPDKSLDDKELDAFVKILPTLTHPTLCPVAFTSLCDTFVVIIRPFAEAGTLRDILCKVKPKAHFLKKYCCPKVCALPPGLVRTVGHKILETLKVLHEKGLPYGHLHSGNIFVTHDGSVQLTDVENGVLGLPSYYRPYFIQFKKISTLESVDVYCFGHVLYEMVFGHGLDAPNCDDRIPPNCPMEIKSILESILSATACKNGLPSIADLLLNKFFSDVSLPQLIPKIGVKFTSKTKESLKVTKTNTETRLQDEQKALHHYRRVTKAQAFHMSEDEKKRRKRDRLRQQLSEGGTSSIAGDEASAPGGVAAAKTVTTEVVPGTPGVVSVPAAPPISEKKLGVNGQDKPSGDRPTSAPRPSSNEGDRGALLTSITSFSKNKLKKAEIMEKSVPKT